MIMMISQEWQALGHTEKEEEDEKGENLTLAIRPLYLAVRPQPSGLNHLQHHHHLVSAGAVSQAPARGKATLPRAGS